MKNIKIDGITIINGPNLNKLGSREPEVYGKDQFEQFFKKSCLQFQQVPLKLKQSNIEGEIINFIQECEEKKQAIVINPGGYTHTSVAISDALASVNNPVIEVHISNIYAREDYRQKNLTAKNTDGVIIGFGLEGYNIAIRSLLHYFN